MGDRKIDLQDTAIADMAGIKGDLDHFRVPRRIAAHHLIMRRVGGAAGVTGDGAGDVFDMLEHALDTPEAAAGEDRDIGRCPRVRRLVEHEGRGRECALGSRLGYPRRHPRSHQERHDAHRRAEIPEAALGDRKFE
jgi:hypothetical protein